MVVLILYAWTIGLFFSNNRNRHAECVMAWEILFWFGIMWQKYYTHMGGVERISPKIILISQKVNLTTSKIIGFWVPSSFMDWWLVKSLCFPPSNTSRIDFQYFANAWKNSAKGNGVTYDVQAQRQWRLWKLAGCHIESMKGQTWYGYCYVLQQF